MKIIDVITSRLLLIFPEISTILSTVVITTVGKKLHVNLGESAADFDGTTQHLCDVLATGVYPTLVVTDARCHGSAIGISKKQLWTLFSLDASVAINPLKPNSSKCYTLPYRPNLPFLISDIRALWRSALSARVPKCQKLKT